MIKKKIVIGNMKMNLTLPQINDYIKQMGACKDFVICPSYPYLSFFIEKGFKVGAQNICEYEKGSFTGEVSAKQIKSLGASYVIIGHSERRTYAHETESEITEKIKQALKNDLNVILCVGETLKDKESGTTKEIIEKQLLSIFDNLKEVDNNKIIIAYEPIWAIGTGQVPTNEQIEKVSEFIKNIIQKNYNFIPNVLYGGSITKENIKKINSIDNIDGFLIGGSCLNPREFTEIINNIR